MGETITVVASGGSEVSVVPDDAFDVANIGNSAVVSHTHPLSQISDMSDQSRAFNAAGDTASQLAAIDLHSSIAVAKEMATVAILVADTTLTYTAGTGNSVAAGDYIRTKAENFVYQVAASGASDQHISTAGGVKLYVLPTAAGHYNFKQMNPAADGVTDDWAKLNVLLTLTPAWVSAGDSRYVAMPPIYFPEGKYYFGQTIDLKRTVKLYGPSALTGNPSASFYFPTDIVGITVNRFNTAGGTTTSTTTAGDGSVIESLYLESASVGSNQSAHAIWLRARAVIRNCTMNKWTGAGIGIVATAGGGGSTEGNANNWRIDTCRMSYCLHGVYVSGADSNSGYGSAIDVSSNRQWGIFDASFLGNTWVGCHAADNGHNSPLTQSAFCSYGGVAYQCYPGVAAATYLSTTPGTNNLVWYPVGSPSGVCIAWTGSNPVGTFAEGGPYRSSNNNSRVTFVNCYTESGQYLSWLAQYGIFLGSMGLGNLGSGVDLGASQSNVGTTVAYKSAQVGLTGTVNDLRMGGGGDQILYFRGYDSGVTNDTGDWRLKRSGDGLRFDHQNLNSRVVFEILGTTNARPYKMQMESMVLGSFGNTRYLGRVQTTTLTAGSYVRGDLFLTADASPSGKIGQVCTTSGVYGSTAVFKTYGAIDP